VNDIDPQANEPNIEEPAVVERSNVGIDLATRPDGEWLNTVQNELNDTDLVLKCLARDSAKMCQTCDVAQSDGELEDRPMLARCASTKQPR
jgi:hypothetical protein